MVRIYCPKCQGRHEVPIVELIAALEAHLAEVRERAEEMGGGKGFML